MLNVQEFKIDTNEVNPISISLLQGEAVEFRFLLYKDGTKVTAISSAEVYYRHEDMEEGEWYKSTAQISNGIVVWNWDSSLDVGASRYAWFVRAKGSGATDISYRALGKFNMLKSPNFTPNEIDLPKQVLDFATIEVLNAPYYSKSQMDEELNAIDVRLQGHDKEIDALREEITGDAEETLKEHEENHNNPHRVKASQLTEKSPTSGGVNATTDTGATIAISGDPLMYNEIVLSVNASGVGINITDEPLLYYGTQGEAQLEFRGTNKYTIYGIEGVVFLQIYIDSAGQYTAISVGYVDDTGDKFFYASTDYFGNTMGKLVSFDYTQSGTYQVLTEAMLRDKVTGKAFTICVENGELKLQEYRATKYEA